jgi:biotin transporter BioY
MGARYFALISGVIYVLIGLFGFIPGMVATPGTGGPEVIVNAGYGYLLDQHFAQFSASSRWSVGNFVLS